MKKLISYMLMLLVLASLAPLSFAAQEREGQTLTVTSTNGTTQQVSMDDLRRMTQTSEENIVDDVRYRNSFADKREHLAERRQELVTELRQGRQQLQQDAQQLRQRVQDRQEALLNARNTFQERRQDMLALREQYTQCRDTETDECLTARGLFTAHSRVMLSSAADVALNALEQARLRIVASDLSDAEKEASLNELDAQVAELTAAQEVVDAVEDNATRGDLETAAQTIRESWQGSQAALQKSANRLANVRLGNIADRLESMQARFVAARDRLEAQGEDVSGLDAVLADLDANIADAVDSYDAAVGEFQAGNQETAHTLLTAAKDSLTAVKESMQDAVQEIRSVAGSTDVLDE